MAHTFLPLHGSLTLLDELDVMLSRSEGDDGDNEGDDDGDEDDDGRGVDLMEAGALAPLRRLRVRGSVGCNFNDIPAERLSSIEIDDVFADTYYGTYMGQ